MNAEQIITGHYWNADRTHCVGCGKSIHTRPALGAHVADELHLAGIDTEHTYTARPVVNRIGPDFGKVLYERRPLDGEG